MKETLQNIHIIKTYDKYNNTEDNKRKRVAGNTIKQNPNLETKYIMEKSKTACYSLLIFYGWREGIWAKSLQKFLKV